MIWAIALVMYWLVMGFAAFMIHSHNNPKSDKFDFVLSMAMGGALLPALILVSTLQKIGLTK